ncbi:O-acetylhomoserine aminocarboxypropyltransferase/cysteine synthase family protein [Protaetiibacter intestinalis]|uniref:homocysteine desulfhydrase n=1 Tax=Protaetiibacter intestinalis TaxID=2419774 RepID=A0A387B569_9MICO|nr:aminotransferase class I/II-fold pyridoxal phosphate-dependent enzyme [Protaetiibacter intestinalis]AYF96888.1 O-acetylhomoserine aminocarboxypropyltransferase/cysteine synthase [Protaetiibacter intestinalis]
MSTSRPVEATLDFATRQLHAARPRDEVRSRTTPIYLSAGFPFDDFDQAAEHFGTGEGFSYTRVANPTTASAERLIAGLEGGAEAVLVGSGQAAIAIALLGLVDAGGHIVAGASLYEGTRGLLGDNLVRLGITTDFVADANDAVAWEALIRPETRALVVESIPNPRNDLVDIALVADVAHAHGIPLVVDNTLATPYLLRPLEHGADIVVHSTSKFLAGHGSVLGGVIVDDGRFDALRSGALFPHLTAPDRLGGPSWWDRFGGRARIAYLRENVAVRFGPTLSPLNAFLLAQGVETLSLRVERQSANALGVAEWLAAQPEVASVDYSGLPGNAAHALAERYLPRGQGSVFAFTLHGGREAARRFVNALELFTPMTHLGDVRSLILHPRSTSHTLRTPEELAAAGISEGTLRVSIGIEHLPDLLRDLERGIAAAREAAAA